MAGARTVADMKAEVLAAIAHPNRIRILELLRNHARCSCELAPALNLEQSNLSRHMKILVHAGVVVSWKEGLRVNFRIADDRVIKIIELARGVARRGAEARSGVLEEA